MFWPVPLPLQQYKNKVKGIQDISFNQNQWCCPFSTGFSSTRLQRVCWCIHVPGRTADLQFHTHTHTHTRLTAPFPGLPGWAGTRKAKPIWILLKQEAVSGSGISLAICKSAPSCRRITTPAPDHSVFLQATALPATQPTASKHWRENYMLDNKW